MTALDLDRLEALADAATPGPWVYGGMGYVEDVPDNPEDRFDVMPETIARAELSEADAVFIAETCPDVVRQLILELREARHMAENLRNQRDQITDETSDRWRKALAHAWDEGHGHCFHVENPAHQKPYNPYRRNDEL